MNNNQFGVDPDENVLAHDAMYSKRIPKEIHARLLGTMTLALVFSPQAMAEQDQ